MENTELTLVELIAIFGEEVANEMYAEQQAAKGKGGAKFPFTTLTKISDIASELGAFGTYVFGVTKEKDATTQEWKITSAGTNLGKAFQFAPVSIFYRYKKWDDVAKKTNYSSIFKQANEGETATEYNGAKLPSTKEAKRDAGWQMQKIVVGLIRQDAKAKFEPCAWEFTGKLFFTYNNVEKKLKQPILGGIINVVTALEKQGSTNYSIIDEAKTTVEAFPITLLQEYKEVLSEITTKTRDYISSKAHKNTIAPVEAAQANTGVVEVTGW